MEKEVKIQIPEGYEIDREKSTFERIVFKKKGLTYEDVMKALLSDKTGYFIESQGTIWESKYASEHTAEPNAATNRRQLEQILALNKLMNVAKYLNGDWKPKSRAVEEKYFIEFNCVERKLIVIWRSISCSSEAYFKSEALARQAIKILGETEVKKALGIFE